MDPTPAVTSGDSGTTIWAMVVLALVAISPSIIATVKAWAGRKKAALELQERKDQLAKEKLDREEKERQAAEERARLHAAVKDLTSQIKAVTVSQETAMKARTDNQASTDAQLADIAESVGAPPHDTEAR